MKHILSLLILLVFVSTSSAQVREVKKRAHHYKSSGSSRENRKSGSSSGSAGNDALAQLMVELLINPIFQGIIFAHNTQIDKDSEEPWRVSMEAHVRGGANYGRVDYFNSQSIRGNFGFISTQIRRFAVKDVSGSFTTIDWQILQLNLINRRSIRWLLGVGLSQEIQVQQAHVEFATELKIGLMQDKLMSSWGYRISDDGYPRREFSTFLEYRPYSMKNREITLSIGYTNQRLYDVPFRFISAGVSFYIK